MSTMEELIRLEGITKQYLQGENIINALAGIDFSIAQGDYFAVMGPSGCGKSTLMYTLGLLARPSSGRYFLEGRDVSGLTGDELADIRNSKIGFVFQSFNLLSKTTVLENVLIPTAYTPGGATKELKERALELLDMVKMSHRLNNHPNQLSGGEQQRVAIARALINAPSLILADEPTGNLDSKTTGEVLDIIDALNEKGNTIIIVTHEDYLAERTKSIIRMKDGKIVG